MAELLKIVNYDGRQAEILSYFNNLADYVWKLPRMLESEVELERRMLDEYWPRTNDPEINATHARLRNFRSAHEASKLFGAFPVLMASSALIQTISAFEYYLLLICYDYEALGGETLNEFRPRGKRGASRLLDYIEQAVPDSANLYHLEQVRHSIVFRNYLAHANGVISLFKDPDALRAIIADKLYFSPELRGREHISGYDSCPRLIGTGLEERLYVPTYYSHWLAAKARDTLIDLCVETTRSSAVVK